ncbi:hypothetical protein [Acetobacterium carbinolicum]|uniref:hypothetical protein n=1 Tax=Acetobacterium carbinolicum TaxID=52690 RepID=UPI0039C91EC6
MRKRILFPATVMIMLFCLGLVFINWIILPLPDWAVRSIGFMMLADLPVLVYSRIRFVQNNP